MSLDLEKLRKSLLKGERRKIEEKAGVKKSTVHAVLTGKIIGTPTVARVVTAAMEVVKERERSQERQINKVATFLEERATKLKTAQP
ncbi:hypothetical protein [Hymenobacter metallicola]|uniref:Uncharacterized protein n=1 Tax=Hymenobacter metallicola TaxID=2563114 RepID=A0A4Z0QJ06_9BACT|nr:hypothetical protein [Hymenobacter metallicola]TGE29754.1 hypothetical protein E5K02_09930 [Hymenobacter metallicola]